MEEWFASEIFRESFLKIPSLEYIELIFSNIKRESNETSACETTFVHETDKVAFASSMAFLQMRMRQGSDLDDICMLLNMLSYVKVKLYLWYYQTIRITRNGQEVFRIVNRTSKPSTQISFDIVDYVNEYNRLMEKRGNDLLNLVCFVNVLALFISIV